jgi:hypothetical protein
MDMTQTVDDVCHLSPERSVVKTRRRQRVYDRITGVASVGTSPVPEASAKGESRVTERHESPPLDRS